MRSPFLVGSKVYLRPLVEEDAAACWDWLNDPDVRRTLAVRAWPNTETISREWIRRLDFRRDMAFAIVTRDEDLYVGNCDLNGINHLDGHAMLGLLIGRKDLWGRGYGTEAVRLLCRYAFEGLALHKVCLSCYATNERGLRLYARVGFVVEGRRREQVFIDGRRVDEVIFGLLASELRS
ncbi:MAG TPA: GNAT family protein [Candidatus Binatia bacterium]|nr:GNAT family protein [Candidatus Binatia bacterium]